MLSRVVGAFLLMVAALHGTGCSPRAGVQGLGHPIVREPEPGTLRVLDWNILMSSCPESVLAHIPIEEVDVVLLQEVKAESAAVLKAHFEKNQFTFVSCVPSDQGKKIDKCPSADPCYWYPAIAVRSRLGRLGPSECWTHPDYDRGLLNGYLRTRLTIGDEEVQLVSLHLAPFTPNLCELRKVHAEQIKRLLGKLECAVPTIIGGDFNEAVFHPAMHRLVTDGFVDGVASIRGAKPASATTFGPPFFPVFPLRFDRVFHDASFETVSSQTLRRGPSDHRPLLVALRMKEARLRPSGASCRSMGDAADAPRD